MTTFASIFTGGGLADVGAKLAGCELLWGVELNPEIAAIASDLAEIKALLRELVETVKDAPRTYPDLEFPANGNGNHDAIVPSAPQNRGSKIG